MKVSKLRIWFAVMLGVVACGGCAYFNTLYNAKRIYKEAEQAPRTPDGGVNRTTLTTYDEVIEKCQHLIAEYPNSKWVDDAVLLMGKSYHGKEEYDDAITKFDELLTNFDKSDLREEAQVMLARSYIDKGEVEQGITALKNMLESTPKGDYTDEALFLLGTNSVKVDREDEAMQFLQTLATNHGGSRFRIDADLEVADLYVERGEYDKALRIYDKLGTTRLNERNRIRYLTKLSEAYVKSGQYQKAAGVFRQLQNYVLTDDLNPTQLLLRGENFVGLAAIPRAIDSYKSVTAAYPRSKYASEAFFRLGVIYQEKLDSLHVAKQNFDNVSRTFANSEFANEAIRRSVSISKLERLRASLDAGQEDDKAALQFDLAEIQFLQFNDVDKALAGYEAVLNEFPTSDVAPKAAYAIAYIHDEVLGNNTSAQQAYLRVISEYPESQQATYARLHLQGAAPPAKTSEDAGNEIKDETDDEAEDDAVEETTDESGAQTKNKIDLQ